MANEVDWLLDVRDPVPFAEHDYHGPFYGNARDLISHIYNNYPHKAVTFQAEAPAPQGTDGAIRKCILHPNERTLDQYVALFESTNFAGSPGA